MPTVTAAEFKVYINDSGLAAATAEEHLDSAIDDLNVFGAGLSNLGGATPNKTLTVTSKQRGAIFLVARKIYYGSYKSVESAGVGSFSAATPDLMSDPAFLNFVEKIAQKLKSSSIAFVVAHDTSDIE